MHSARTSIAGLIVALAFSLFGTTSGLAQVEARLDYYHNCDFVRPGLRCYNSVGNASTVSPAPGYVWASENREDLTVKVRPDLRIHSYDANGNALFIPAPGYEWANYPHDLTTRVRSDLRIHSYDANSFARFIPASGHVWVGDPNNLQTRLIDGLIQGVDGKYSLSNGYVWVDPSDPNNLDVSLMEGLRKNADGTFRSAPGYTWVFPEDPQDFQVKVKRDLRLERVNADGSSTFYPASGYEWVGNPNNLQTRLIDGLHENADGTLQPDSGYRWVDPDDPNNFEVRERTERDYLDRGDINPPDRSVDRANRSPAMGAALSQWVGVGAKAIVEKEQQRQKDMDYIQATTPAGRNGRDSGGNSGGNAGSNSGGNSNGNSGDKGKGGPDGRGPSGSIGGRN